jgi:hypothetical protein
MAQQIKKKFIGSDQIDGSKIKLLEGQSIRGTNSLGEEVDLIKISSQDEVQVLGQEVALKSELDTEATRLEGLISQEADDRETADESLSLSISSLQSQVAIDIQQAISNESSLREAADSALSDLVDIEKARIDAILLASDADKDSFKEIVDLINSVDTENDSAFAGYVQSNNAALAQEILDRQSGDTTLQDQINTLKNFSYDQTIHVAKNGLDTNSGKQHSPFLTITAAQNSILDASPTKRYVIKVAPGLYTESIALKANVFIVSEGQKESVRISGVVTLDSSFSGSGDHRSGLSNITLLLTSNFNWQTVTSAAGKLFFNEVAFNQSVTMYGHNNAIAQAQFANCIFYGDLIVSGINVGVFADNVCFANIQLNQHPNSGMATVLNASGGYCSGAVTLTTTVNNFGRRCGLFARSFYMNSITVNGSSSYADLTDSSIPSSGPTVLNSGNIVYLNRADANRTLSNLEYPTAVNYPIMPASSGATNLGDWGKQWAWTFSYVHASSGSDAYLISYGSSFGADSVGRSVGILADGAGLQENVNGGNVSISTSSTVSGTGIRGKIILDGREIDASNKQIKNLASGTDAADAINKGQLDVIDEKIETEKNRINAILIASDADKDSFAEIVALINSVDTENDTAFAGYVLSNNAAVSDLDVYAQDIRSDVDENTSSISSHALRLDAIEAQTDGPFFSNGSVTVGVELAFIDLDKQYIKLMSCAVGRLMVHEDEDFTVSVVDGKTRLTWIGSLVNPSGEEKIETGDKVFFVGCY